MVCIMVYRCKAVWVYSRLQQKRKMRKREQVKKNLTELNN